MYQKSKRININYAPLNTTCWAEELNTIPATQTFFAQSGEYAPDYTLTPLSIKFYCSIQDPTQVLKDGVINPSLANVKFYEVNGKTETLITSDNKNYVISDGDDKGKIQLKKNVAQNTSLTIRFEAEFLDTRTGQIYKFKKSKLITCIDASEGVPAFTLDKPASVFYNPIRDTAKFEINASAMFSGTEIDDTHCKVFFYKVDDDGNLADVDSLEAPNEIISHGKKQLVIDRSAMGISATYVAKLTYNLKGTPANAPTPISPQASCAIRRRIPALEVDWVLGSQVSAGTKSVKVKPVIKDTAGTIPDNGVLSYLWETSVDGGTTWKEASTDKEPSIPFTAGMMIRLTVSDNVSGIEIPSGYALVADTDGSVIVDTDGAYIIDLV